jgi:NAD(P)-dependent dehydrogenase (short-subunit alcohol dehydrogenase family)
VAVYPLNHNLHREGILRLTRAPWQAPTLERRAATYLRRMADDHDLGGPVIFLLSEAARYITGANLPVDGGYTAH